MNHDSKARAALPAIQVGDRIRVKKENGKLNIICYWDEIQTYTIRHIGDFFWIPLFNTKKNV